MAETKKAVSWPRRLILYALVATVLYGFVQLADRALYVLSPVYPSFMVYRDLGDVDGAGMVALRDGDCAAGPIESERKHSYILLRCGSTAVSLDRRIFTAKSFMGMKPLGDSGSE